MISDYDMAGVVWCVCECRSSTEGKGGIGMKCMCPLHK